VSLWGCLLGLLRLAAMLGVGVVYVALGSRECLEWEDSRSRHSVVVVVVVQLVLCYVLRMGGFAIKFARRALRSAGGLLTL